jgi:hypothetical protein
MANDLHDFLRVIIKTGTDHCREGADRRAGWRNTMEWSLKIHIDESDKELLETPASKQALEQAVYKTILTLRDAEYSRLSRPFGLGNFRGTDK